MNAPKLAFPQYNFPFFIQNFPLYTAIPASPSNQSIEFEENNLHNFSSDGVNLIKKLVMT